MIRFLLLAGLFALAAFSQGCTDPELARVKWDSSAPTIQPDEPGEATAPAPNGKLVILTSPDVIVTDEENSPRNRGYAVFDESGKLRHTTLDYPGYKGGEDMALPLEPGRYIVVSVIDTGTFSHRLAKQQAVVEPNRSTRVDFLHSREEHPAGGEVEGTAEPPSP